MLSKTTQQAIRALIYLTLDESRAPLTPRFIADRLGSSPTYMAKVTRLLAKADILRSRRGARGGVSLSRSPEAMSLLDIIEACQGRIPTDYCQDQDNPQLVCAFHRAMLEVHQATTSVLKRWTLAELAAKPGPSEPLLGVVNCKILPARKEKEETV